MKNDVSQIDRGGTHEESAERTTSSGPPSGPQRIGPAGDSGGAPHPVGQWSADTNVGFGDAVGHPFRPSFAAGAAAGWMLAKREWLRFVRQQNRFAAAIIQPLVFWLLFGIGLGGSFSFAGEQDFLEFFLPGTVCLIVLFSAIFSTVSVIEDRREGFMQGVLVAPVGRWPVLAGKVVGGAAVAWLQALLFLALAWAIGTVTPGWNAIPIVALLGLLAVGMCGLGMIVAWPMESTQGFHAIMMLGLMPMWLLSGSFFPITSLESATGWGPWVLGVMMRCNPLSYGLFELRRLLYPEIEFATTGFAPSPMVGWGVTVVAAVVTLLIAWILMRGSRRVDVAV